MAPSPSRPANMAAARVLWGVSFGGVAGIALLAIAVSLVFEPIWPHLRDATFYIGASANVCALAWALYCQDRLRRRLRRATESELQRSLIYEAARRSAPPMAAGGFLAAIGIVAAGAWALVLVLVPVFGFGLVFRPGSKTSRLLLAQ